MADSERLREFRFGEHGERSCFAVLHFEFTRCNGLFAHDDPCRDADEVGIGKFLAGPEVAVIVEHFDAFLQKRCVEGFCSRPYFFSVCTEH